MGLEYQYKTNITAHNYRKNQKKRHTVSIIENR